MDSYQRLLHNDLKNERKCYEWLIKKNFAFTKMTKASEKFRKQGNELYLQKRHTAHTHREIFKNYCESVMFAPLKSEQMALALGNRSAFLLHIKKYEDCIVDIDKAVGISKSYELKIKLLCRKIQCLKMLGSSDYQSDFDEIDIYIDKISDGKSKSQLIKALKKVQAYPIIKKETNTPCIQFNCLPEVNDIFEQIEIRHSERFGRYTVAAKDYKPGDIIFIEDQYATTVQFERLCISCQYCLKTTWSGIPCDECSWAIFCSEDCKKKAWKEFHDVECTTIPYMRLNTETITSDMGLRLLVLGLKECGSVEKLREQLKSVDECTDVVRKGFYKDGKLSTNSIRTVYGLKTDGLPKHLVENVVKAIPSILIGLVKSRRLPKNYEIKKVKDILNNDDLMFLGSLLIKFTAVLMTNGYSNNASYKCEISEDPDKLCERESCCQRAICIAPFASLINQSCFPNASRCLTADNKMIIYAVHPIEKDSQIFVTYCSAFYLHPLYERQETLYENYGFECDCIACDEAWPTILDEEYNFIIEGSPQEKIFKSCETIIANIHDNTETIQYDKKTVHILSTAISKAFKSLEQPSHLTCLLIKTLTLYYTRTLYLQPESFGECEKFL